jgi:hypothetical protein
MLHYMFLELAQANGDGEGDRVDGSLYNMLRKVKRTERAQPPFFSRVEVRHNPYELETYKIHMRATIDEMLDADRKFTILRDDPTYYDSHHALAPPTPAPDCAWSCDFFQVCGMLDDGSRAEDMITQLFKTSEHLDYYVAVNDEKGQ